MLDQYQYYYGTFSCQSKGTDCSLSLSREIAKKHRNLPGIGLDDVEALVIQDAPEHKIAQKRNSNLLNKEKE